MPVINTLEIKLGSVHVRTERAQAIAHEVGNDLFHGNTPFGQGLKRFKRSPRQWLIEGVNNDDVFHSLENLEIIKLRINEVGVKEFCLQLIQAGIQILF